MYRLLTTLFVASLFVAPTFAQTAPSVAVSGIADMPSLKDDGKLDSFSTTNVDGQISTKIVLACTAAGHNDFGFIRRDRICAFDKTSTGAVFNSKSNQWLPRTQYVGSYTVTADGTTDGRTMSINYLALGSAPANSVTFGGSLNLKPELTSSGAAGLRDLVLSKLSGDSGAPINTAVDTIDFNHFFIPGSGLPSDKGCTWSGNAVFAYQTYSWFFKVSADCVTSVNGQDQTATYALAGNMPFTDSPGVEGQTQYDVVLSLPTTAVTGDDALFADAGGDGDLFAVADGISGQIVMKNSKNVDVMIDGEKVNTPGYVEFNGKLTGNSVPLGLVRSFANVLGLLPVTFYGP